MNFKVQLDRYLTRTPEDFFGFGNKDYDSWCEEVYEWYSEEFDEKMVQSPEAENIIGSDIETKLHSELFKICRPKIAAQAIEEFFSRLPEDIDFRTYKLYGKGCCRALNPDFESLIAEILEWAQVKQENDIETKSEVCYE